MLSLEQTPDWGTLKTGGGSVRTAVSSATSATNEIQIEVAGTGPATDVVEPVRFKIEVTTAGASGTAQVTTSIDRNQTGTAWTVVNSSGQTVTSGTPLALVGSGSNNFTVELTWTGSLSLGDTWYITRWPAGFHYSPVTTGIEEARFITNVDGIQHDLTGARGTFTFEATAGDKGMFNFTFTGNYNNPQDVTMPSVRDLQSIPPIFERAHFAVGGYAGYINAINFDIANNVVTRQDANAADGFNGVLITNRAPTGGFDPEADTISNQNFWNDLAIASEKQVYFKIGQSQGNQLFIDFPNIQYSGVSYQDREGIRAYDVGYNINPQNGNDEINILIA